MSSDNKILPDLSPLLNTFNEIKNHHTQKQVIPISIGKATTPDGSYTYNFISPVNLKPNSTYFMSLIYFSGWQNISDISWC